MESTKKSVKHTLNELSSPKTSRVTGKHVAPIYKRGSIDSGVKRSAIRGTIRDIRRLNQLAKPYRYLENALDRYKDLVPPQSKKEPPRDIKAEVSPKALKYIASDRIKELAQPIRR
ncbi:hypothetical protein PPYR_12440 [Photinus pyralis]|uniref:Uncharacterized protein n=1 Tax=Photinus pyralis TaxID=7054 RepID=A0A1Y1NMK0_PHOPY|nr:hypothetical protein PPYR_12440 [Photinus pyralis]